MKGTNFLERENVGTGKNIEQTLASKRNSLSRELKGQELIQIIEENKPARSTHNLISAEREIRRQDTDKQV